jgi:hypothetical protein
MGQKGTQKQAIEDYMRDLEVPVKMTIGTLQKIRNDNGYYEAQVASMVSPSWWKEGRPYLLGWIVNEHDQYKVGAWIKFGDSAEVIVAQWQPRKGDRVVVYTYGSYGYGNGRIFRLPTSYDTNAKIAEDMQVNGPLRTLSGGML